MAHNTDAIHAGYEPDEFMGSINVPIYASTTFAQNAPNELRGGYAVSYTHLRAHETS